MDRSVVVRIRADIIAYKRDLTEASLITTRFGHQVDGLDGPLGRMEDRAQRGGAEIDKLSGRLRVMADAALIGAPALTAFGAAGVGALVALAAEAGAAAGALGVTVLAVKGLGDGLKALDAYRLDPTSENLAKLNEELTKLGPSGAHFVEFLSRAEPELKSLQYAARDGLLPGAEEGIDALLQKTPELRSLISAFATEVGDLSADAGKGLAGERFQKFLNYLETDGVPILDDTARTVANLALAGANLLAAFSPVQMRFGGGLLDFSKDLADASNQLDDSAGFRDLLSYIEIEGPHAVDTLGSIANMFLQIVEASAPLAGPVLTTLGAVADVIARIADSDLGTPIFAGFLALAAYNRALAINVKLQEQAAAGSKTATGLIVGNINAQRAAVMSLPSAYREVAAAEAELAAAEKAFNAARIQYVGQLQAQNRLRASGVAVSGQAEARLADSLGRVEVANYGVQTATERVTTAQGAQKGTLRSTAAEAGKAAALVGGLALATSDVGQQSGLANAASMAMLGTIAGPWGAAIGGGIGLLLDFKGAYDDLNTSIAEVNDAAEGSSIPDLEEQIAAKTKQLRALQYDQQHTSLTEGIEQIGLTGFGLSGLPGAQDHIGDFTGKTGELKDSIAAAQKQLAGLRDGSVEAFNPVSTLAGAIEDSAQAAMDEAQALRDAVDAMQAKRQEALRSLDAELNYQQAIDDAKKALKDNGKTVDETTEKGRDNLRALYALADGWNQQSNAAKNAKGSLQGARQGFIETATSMGMAEGKAKQLADQLFEIPPKRKTEIELDGVDPAIDKAKTLKQILDGLHSKSIDIALHYQTIGNKPHAPIPGGDPTAGGGLITGPGGPTDDKIPLLVSNREFVMRNAAVEKYGVGFMHDVNALKFADGGLAGNTYTRRQSGDGGTAGSRHGDSRDEPGVQILVTPVWSVADALKAFKAELEASQKTLAKEKQQREDAISTRDAFVSSVGGAYAKADPFSGQLSNFDAATAANTNDTNAADSALALAASHGLDGPLYQALASSGNLELVQQFAGLSAADIQQRELLFASQSQSQTTLGADAAQAAGLTTAVKDFDKLVRESQKTNRSLQQTVNRLEKAVERGAEKGTHTGTKAAQDARNSRLAGQSATQARPLVRSGR